MDIHAHNIKAGEVDARQLHRILGEDAWRLTPATLATVLSHGAWLPAKHLLYVAAKIASAIERGNARLCISLPTRHGKSELLSFWTAVWALDRNPATEIILATYGADLSQDFSRKVRDVLIEYESPESLYSLNARLRHGARRVGGFMTLEGGGMRAVGIGGPVAGRGADLFLFDDYLKNAKEAASPTILQDIWDWFVSVGINRLSPNGSIVILATRWNIRDLIGRLKDLDDESGIFPWEFIEFPCFALENDILGREVGETLWPERYTKEHMQSIKDLEGNYFWQAVHQQRPIPRSGGQVDASHFPIVDIVPKRMELVRWWDFAASPGKGDYAIGLLMGKDPKTKFAYICDVIRRQVGPGDLEICVKNTAEQDGYGVRVCIEQEPGSAGKIVIDHYQRNVLSGWAVEGIRPTGDKFVRAQPYYAAAQAHHIKMLRGAWNDKYVEEAVLFPDAENDDQVDASSGAFNRLFQKTYKGVVWGRSSTSEDQDQSIRGSQEDSKIIAGATFGRNQ